jgi:acyl dehydratase
MPWLEDIPLGMRTELGTHTFTEEEIIAFARKFDPQPFHIDPEAARTGPFGGLVASGWHTTAIWMKLMVRSRLNSDGPADPDGTKPPAGGPSPGFLELKWPVPVRPGDTISFSTTTREKIDMKSRPNMGIIRSLNEGVNQKGETVLSFLGQGLIMRRNPLRE